MRSSFVLLWVALLIVGAGQGRDDGSPTPDLLQVGVYCFAILGSLIGLWWAYASIRLLRESITIDGDVLTYRAGRNQMSCQLTDVQAIELVDSDLKDGSRRSSFYSPKMYNVFTKAGIFRFYPSISNSSELCEAFNKASSDHAALDASAVVEVGGSQT